jgi:hypothetical protein
MHHPTNVMLLWIQEQTSYSVYTNNPFYTFKNLRTKMFPTFLGDPTIPLQHPMGSLDWVDSIFCGCLQPLEHRPSDPSFEGEQSLPTEPAKVSTITVFVIIRTTSAFLPESSDCQRTTESCITGIKSLMHR